jgi:hypothetical protein
MIPPQKKKGGPSYDGHQTEKSVGEVLVPGLAITRLRVIFRLQSHIRERASTVTDTGQHHHDQLACDLGMRVGNACIVHVVVLELAVLVCLYGPPRSIVVTQFDDLVTDIASPRPHGRSLSSAKALRREGGPEAALEGVCSVPSCPGSTETRSPTPYSMISTMRRLRDSTITG